MKVELPECPVWGDRCRLYADTQCDCNSNAQQLRNEGLSRGCAYRTEEKEVEEEGDSPFTYVLASPERFELSFSDLESDVLAIITTGPKLERHGIQLPHPY